MAVNNWIADENLFGLQKPPDWWLQRLFDFDHMLVILPSRKDRKSYLIARRRQFSVGLGDVAMLDNKHPDTNMCYVHGVLPINMRLNVEGSNPFTETTINFLLDELRRRDTWALTGEAGKRNPEAFADAVDAADAAREKKTNDGIREKFYQLGRDAYRSLKARTGQRNRRASDYHGHARAPKRKVGEIKTPSTNP